MQRIAAVQFKATKGNWQESADRLTKLVESGCPDGVDLLVCPEMALTGYVFANSGDARAVAEPAGAGRTFHLASELAKRFGTYVVIGYPEAAPDGPLYNSALLVAPDGGLLQNYRKRFLYEMDETWATPGDTAYPLIDTPLGLLTCGICMDLNDNRFVEFLFDAGPRIIAFPTNWLDQGFEVRGYWLRRLHGYQGWLIAANTYGWEEGTRFRGRSSILDPDGFTVALAPPEGDAVIISVYDED